MSKTSLIETRTDPLIMDLPFSHEEYQRRLNGCRELMNETEIDAFISFTPENIYYLTGHDTPGYYYLQACVVTHDHDPVVFTRKIESFNTLGRSWKRKTCPYGDTDNPVTLGMLFFNAERMRVLFYKFYRSSLSSPETFLAAPIWKYLLGDCH